MTAERLSLSLNGSSQYAEITSSPLTHSADFSVMGWFRATGDASSSDIYRTTYAGLDYADNVIFQVNAGSQLKLRVTNGGAVVSGSVADTVELGRWYHWAMVQDGNDVTLYLDGEIYDTVTQTASTRAAATQMGLGIDPGPNTQHFQGRFYGVKAWTRALSQAEVQTELPSIPAVSTASIYGEWQSADTDTSGNANHWTLVGSPSFSEDTPFDRMRSGSLSLSGGAYAQITGGAIDHSQDLCISGWVRVPNSVGSTGHIFRTQNISSSIILLQWSSGNLMKLTALNGGAVVLASTSARSLGQWYHWAVVQEGSSLKLYVDGVELVSLTQTASTRGVNNNIAFGADVYGSQPLECDLYALKAWQRALTQTELEIEMQSVEPVVLESLYAYWPHVPEDLSGNQNSPLIIGTETYTDAPPIPLGTSSALLAPPAAAVGGGVSVTPGAASLTTTGYTPSVTATANVTLVPSAADVGLTTYAPTVVATANVAVSPATVALATTLYAPTVSTASSGSVSVTPSTATLVTALFAPSVVTGPNVVPRNAALSTTRYAPTATTGKWLYPASVALPTTGLLLPTVVPLPVRLTA